MAKRKRVSVIIPVFNKTAYLATSLDSVIENTSRSDEIIVIDDGSDPDYTDEIATVLKPYMEKIRFYKIEHSGPSGALNYAISKANGQFISTFSSDDIMFSGHLDRAVNTIRSQNVDFFFSTCMGIDRKGKNTGKGANGIFTTSLTGRVFSPQEHIEKLFFEGNYFCAPTMVATKKALETIGLYHCGSLQLQDFHIVLKAALNNYRFIIHDTPSIGYRRDADIESLSGPQSKNRHDIELLVILDDVLSGLSSDALIDSFKNRLGSATRDFGPELLKAYLLISHKRSAVKQMGIQKMLHFSKSRDNALALQKAMQLQGNELNEWIDIAVNW